MNEAIILNEAIRLNERIFHLLRDGGYILYARHGAADVGEDRPDLNFLDCSSQRNLSPEGKRQAIHYGRWIHDFRIPVEYPVLASPFCRAIETARLAFGDFRIQADNFWLHIYRLHQNLPETEKRRILDTLQSRLEIIPTKGYNKVIIAHSFPEGTGLGRIPDMGTVVIRPGGRGKGYEIVGRLSLEDLKYLEELIISKN